MSFKILNLRLINPFFIDFLKIFPQFQQTSIDSAGSKLHETVSSQEENLYLRKEAQLLQKKLDLLVMSLSEEKEDNQEIFKRMNEENEALKKDLAASEQRRMELEKEMIQIAKSSRMFLISEEFDSLKKTFTGKITFYQERMQAFEEKIQSLINENQGLRETLAEKMIEMKKMQINEQTPQEKSTLNTNYAVNDDVMNEKDQIILNSYEKIKDLRAELDVFKMRHEEFRRSKEEKEGEMELEICRLEVENEKLQKKVKELTKEKTSLFEENSKIKEEFSRIKAEIQTLQEKIQFIEKERGLKEEKLSLILVKAIEIGGNQLVDKLTGAG